MEKSIIFQLLVLEDYWGFSDTFDSVCGQNKEVCFIFQHLVENFQLPHVLRLSEGWISSENMLEKALKEALP